MSSPGRIVALAPIDAPRRTTVRANCSGYCLLRGNGSFVNVAFGTDEDVVLESYAVPQLHAALDRDAVADHDVVLDEDVVADVAVAPDPRTWQHVRERPDARALADRVGLADRLGMDERAHGQGRASVSDAGTLDSRCRWQRRRGDCVL